MNTFRDMELSAPVRSTLEKLQFETPTPIQVAAIPPALQGKDILGTAQTGSGKTVAFIIPIIEHLLKSNNGTVALIVVPTRELAQQVVRCVEPFARDTKFKTALLIGGEPIGKQLQQLRAKPNILVGTPGRILDHIDQKTVLTKFIKFLVLDETDQMFDMGFAVQLKNILSQLPKDRQTLMFSATLPAEIISIAKQNLRSPEHITIDAVRQPAASITQEELIVTETDKYQKLLDELQKRDGSIIIFVKTKWGAKKLALRLERDKFDSDALHGDLRQEKRKKVIDGFRLGRYGVLVATNVAARGLDIPHIKHVINYDLPQTVEDYIHRIGRTGRAGNTGFSLCFVTAKERRRWKEISRQLQQEQAA